MTSRRVLSAAAALAAITMSGAAFAQAGTNLVPPTDGSTAPVQSTRTTNAPDNPTTPPPRDVPEWTGISATSPREGSGYQRTWLRRPTHNRPDLFLTPAATAYATPTPDQYGRAMATPAVRTEAVVNGISF